MRVLFIILNYQTYNDTITLTEDIVAQKKSEDAVLIVDNDSPNNSFQLIKRRFEGMPQDVIVIKSDKNGGFAYGNNFGLRYAKKFMPKYACIINNDIRFSYSTIEYLCNIYTLIPNAGIIAPIQYNIDGRQTIFQTLDIPNIWTDIRRYLFIFKNKKHIYKENCNVRNIQLVGMIPGAFMFIDYELLAGVDFFDEDTFLYCEERFIAKKLLDNNRRNYIVLNQKYRHEHSKTISTVYQESRQKKMILEGRLIYAQKYYSFPRLKCTILRVVYVYNIIGGAIVHYIKNKCLRGE